MTIDDIKSNSIVLNMENYFLHSPYSSAKNAKEKEAAAALRMHADNLVSEIILDKLIQELKSDIEKLNNNYKRSRTLSVRMSEGVTEGHKVLYIENGTGNSIASISVFRVRCERY